MTSGRAESSAPDWIDVVTDAALLDLPAAHTRPDFISSNMEKLEVGIDPDTARRARALVDDAPGEVASVLLAAWQALLFRYTEQNDIVLGCTHASRGGGSDDSGRLLRLKPSAEMSFRELVGRARTDGSAQRAAEAPSFRAVLEALQIEATAAILTYFGVK